MFFAFVVAIPFCLVIFSEISKESGNTLNSILFKKALQNRLNIPIFSIIF